MATASKKPSQSSKPAIDAAQKAGQADAAPKAQAQPAQQPAQRAQAAGRADAQARSVVRARAEDGVILEDGHQYADGKLNSATAVNTIHLVEELQTKLNEKLGYMNAHAPAAVKASLAAAQAKDPKVSPEALADVSANAAALAGKDGVVAKTIGTQATKHAQAAIDHHFRTVRQQLDSSIDAFRPNSLDGMPANKQRLRAQIDADFITKVAAAYKSAQTEAMAAITQIKDSDLDTAMRAQVDRGSSHTDELAKRRDNASVDKIAHDTAVGTITPMEAKVRAYLENKIGAKGAHFWRSDELKKFRGGLKDMARDEMHGQIKGKMTKGGDAEKEYREMIARDAAYDGAKEAVNESLTTLATNGVDVVFSDKQAEITKLQGIASQAAWGVLRTAADQKAAQAAEPAATKAASAAIEAEAKTYLDAKMLRAKGWKNDIVGKKDDPKAAAAAPHDAVQQKAALEQDIKTKSGQKVAAAITVGDGYEATNVLGPLLNTGVPHEGTECTFDLAFKIPISHGAFAEFAIGCKAKRDEDGTALGASFKLGAGWDMVGLEAKAHLEFFVESHGKTTNDAVQLIWYGLYRRLADHSPAVASWFGGKRLSEKRTNMSRAEQNETWAAMVEEQSLGDDKSFVNSGMGADAGVKFNAGALQGDATLAGRYGTRIDKESLEKQHGHAKLDHTGDFDARKATAEKAAAAKKKGKTTKKVGVDVGFEVGLDAMKFEVGGKFDYASAGDESEVDFEVSFGVPVKDTGDTQKLTNVIIGKFIPSAVGVCKNLYSTFHKKDVPDGGAGTGAVVDGVGDAFGGLDSAVALGKGDMQNTLLHHLTQVSLGSAQPHDAILNTPNQGAVDFFHTPTDEVEHTTPFATESALEVAFGLKHEKGKWVPRIEVMQTKKMEVNVGIGGAGMKVDITKKQRLADLEDMKNGAKLIKKGALAVADGLSKLDPSVVSAGLAPVHP